LFISQQIVDQMENFRTELKTKLDEKETQSEEQEESAAEAVERKFVAVEEYNKRMEMVEDLRTEMVNMKEKVKQEEQMLKCNLKSLQEECTNLIAMNPSVQREEEKLKETKEKVELLTAHILDVDEQAKTFFAEYDAIYEDLIQKLKGQMSCLMEQQHEPKK